MLDAINHKKVLDIVFADYKAGQISEERIKSLHAILMDDMDQWSDYGQYSPGRYKMFENFTVRSSGKVHSYLHPEQVQGAMAELISKTNRNIGEVDLESIDKHPLNIATIFHQTFLNEIHPFSDGNGRIGRIFMNLIIMKAGLPPIFIKEVDRHEYLARFEQPESTAMLDLMADRLLESLKVKLDFVRTQKLSDNENEEVR